MNHDRESHLRDALKGYCEHVPPAINSASVQRVQKFKEAVASGNRILKKQRVSEAELQSAINLLHTYWL